jgi:WD40 repeat protein
MSSFLWCEIHVAIAASLVAKLAEAENDRNAAPIQRADADSDSARDAHRVHGFAREKRGACLSRGNTARVWDSATGKALATLEGHTDSVRCAALHPSGEILVTGSADKTVKLWRAR